MLKFVIGVIFILLVYLQMIETDEDRAKFEQIYTEYKELMFHIAYQRLRHIQDAEDAVHHAFVKIAKNIEKTKKFVQNHPLPSY